MLCSYQLVKKTVRNFSKYVDKDRSGKAIRQKFLDYFVNQNNHCLVKSSPVVPFCDPTVAFVNSGMNQVEEFKGVLMGTQAPQHKKVTNSQKCVRVGGKHNDLNVVGSDGYHHTFFEMLGNWSFGEYFKKEACEMAWKLLTEEFKIHPSRLYVTYFEGDSHLGIETDLETKEIWKSIGIPADRILPFTSKENFWEMGSIGPCGPCTEIHIDHVTTNNRANLVNRGLHDLTELWNIVFIQYNRKNSNSLELLPEKHVDTGMGFERLTAVLQGKISNYDTDNFTYLLKAIHKNCSKLSEYSGKFGENDWNSLDTSYRILSDHARMITVCLADAMIPEQNQKLRRIMRRSFLISESVFKKDRGLLKELSNYVIENLGPVYGEMERNVNQIHQIIDYEEEVYRSVRKSANEEWLKLVGDRAQFLALDINETPNLVAGYKEIKASDVKQIDDNLAFKLYDTFGLDQDAISSLAKALNLKFDMQGLHKQLELAKNRTKELNTLIVNDIYRKFERGQIPKTKRSNLYNYTKDGNNYGFKKLGVKILKILHNNELVGKIGVEKLCSLLLDKSNLYTEAGGQIGDKGRIIFNKNIFEIIETQNHDGYILHKGFFHSENDATLKEGDFGILEIDPQFRLENMRNHTAIHLLNSTLKAIKGATCQKSSKVTPNYFNLDVSIFGEKLSMSEIDTIETLVKNLIKKNLPVKVSEVDSQQLSSLNDVTMIPGEIYPECGIRIVEIASPDGFLSREPCCGTHVLSTGDLEDFCIVSVKSLGRGTASIHGVTGLRAKTAKANAIELKNKVEILEENFKSGVEKPDVLNSTISSLKHKINFDVEDANILSVVFKQRCMDSLQKISRQIKELTKKDSTEVIELEVKDALMSNILKTKSNHRYLVHYLKHSVNVTNVPLQKATKFCADIPVLVISYSDNMVKARCCIPENLKSEKFDAEKWLLQTVASVFASSLVPPKGYDPALVSNMKSKRIKKSDFDGLLQKSIEVAQRFIEERL